MKVNGCGCCGSPWVTFTYKGKKIIDMTTKIKLPLIPEAHTTIDIQDNEGNWTSADVFTVSQLVDYARAAVEADRAQDVPNLREMFNKGWCAAARFCDREDVVYDGLVGHGACPAFEDEYRDALTSLSAAPRKDPSEDETELDEERLAMEAVMESLDHSTLPAEPVKVPSDDLAHEIWAAAQTAPGEGIEDAVERIGAILARQQRNVDSAKHQEQPPVGAQVIDWLMSNPVVIAVLVVIVTIAFAAIV